MVNSLKGSIMLIFRLKKKDFHLFLVSHGIFPSAFTHTHTHTHTHIFMHAHIAGLRKGVSVKNYS